MLLAQLGLPLPAMPMLIVAGALIAEGTVHVAPLALIVTVGSLMGDVPWYLAGRRYGYRVLGTVCRISVEPDTCVKQTENIFSRWGPASLLVAKYIPGFSTVAPPLAGTMRWVSEVSDLQRKVPRSCGRSFPSLRRVLVSIEQVDWVLENLETMGTGAIIVIGAVVLTYVAVKAVERYLLIRFLRMVRITVRDLRQDDSIAVRCRSYSTCARLSRAKPSREIPAR